MSNPVGPYEASERIDQELYAEGVARGTIPNSHGYREPHVCPFPDAAVGDTYTCPACKRQWVCKAKGPLDIRWSLA